MERSPAAGARRDDALLFFAARLPTELKEAALATIRASDESTRLLHLARFDAELTDAERRELVETPWNVYTRDTPRCQAEHLERVAAHLPKVPAALRERWLEIVLRFQDDYDLQRGLVALLPALAGEGRRRAADALVRSVIREGRFYTIEQPWELLPDDAFGPLLRRLQDDAYGWSRAAIIAHLIDARAPALVDRCMQPLLDALPEREPDHRVELVDAMTPWLADRSGGAVPRALAAMSVPPSSQAVNPLYAIQRVLGRRRRELENPG